MNNLKKRITIFILGVSCAAQAQLTDSIQLNKNPFYLSILDQLEQSPLFFTNQKLKSFTQTQLDYEHKDLDFKRIQTADKSDIFHFSTHGIYNVNPQLKLFGSFDFHKANEQGLAYNFSDQDTENQNVIASNYFFAPKAGDWERQNYALKGGGTYRLKNNISFGATAFYNNEKSFRTNDPRPDYRISDFGGTLHGGYSYKNHSAFVKGGISRKTQTTTILYVNDLLNAPAYPETFIRYSSGYGRVVYNSNYSSHLYQTINENFGAGYQYQYNKNKFSIDYQYNKSMENAYRKDGNGSVFIEDDLILYKYRIKTHNVDFNYFHDGEFTDYKLALNYNTRQDDNYSIAEQGQNYRSTIDSYSLKSGIIKNSAKKTLYSFGLNLDYRDHSYIDLLGYTDKFLNTLEVGAWFNKDVIANEKYKLNLELSAAYYNALDEGLIYNAIASDTTFSEAVIIPDHAYDVTSKIKTGIEGHFEIQLPKNKSLVIFVKHLMLSSAGDEHKNYLPNYTPGTSTWLNGGLKINY